MTYEDRLQLSERFIMIDPLWGHFGGGPTWFRVSYIRKVLSTVVRVTRHDHSGDSWLQLARGLIQCSIDVES